MRRVLLILVLAGCGGGSSDSQPSESQWYSTCGDPVCNAYSGPFAGVPLCADDGIEAGATCGSDELGSECDPVDDCNARLRCAESDPTQEPGGCPISRSAHKAQVTYLTAAERAAAAASVQELRLASWRYKGALDDGAEHVGFLIDDAAPSPAVRPDGEHVDLYGYTSLVVAALQEQQAQIATLEARLAEVESACQLAAESAPVVGE